MNLWLSQKLRLPLTMEVMVNKKQTRNVSYYNFDMIISVRYHTNHNSKYNLNMLLFI